MFHVHGHSLRSDLLIGAFTQPDFAPCDASTSLFATRSSLHRLDDYFQIRLANRPHFKTVRRIFDDGRAPTVGQTHKRLDPKPGVVGDKRGCEPEAMGQSKR
jgi:hypothetical protein